MNGQATREARPIKYRLGLGHVLALGHDRAKCTACAYEAGRRDALKRAAHSLRDGAL